MHDHPTALKDENRDLTTNGLSAMSSMVKQHRNHPSVLLYSVCNEAECDSSSNKNHTLYQLFENQVTTHFSIEYATPQANCMHSSRRRTSWTQIVQ